MRNNQKRREKGVLSPSLPVLFPGARSFFAGRKGGDRSSGDNPPFGGQGSGVSPAKPVRRRGYLRALSPPRPRGPSGNKPHPPPFPRRGEGRLRFGLSGPGDGRSGGGGSPGDFGRAAHPGSGRPGVPRSRSPCSAFSPRSPRAKNVPFPSPTLLGGQHRRSGKGFP